MIAAKLAGGAALVQRLSERAAKAASARAESKVRRANDDDTRWRSPRLLWPGFGDDR